MNAIGRNIIIKKLKEGVTETKGGLLLAESHREDIRYVEATVVSTGNECDGIKKDDVIYYDRHAGHKIELDRETFHVIKTGDVVFVL
jgi:co-chaperonin GroES (HSP10)|tara:strand:+ start:2285 stop:2545 length:261 start_codon:yes stop_codon:yes gene_type:complete